MKKKTIPGGMIVQLFAATKREVELPDPVGKKITYTVHAAFLRIPYKEDEAGPAAFGFGFTEEAAWNQAVQLIEKELA